MRRLSLYAAVAVLVAMVNLSVAHAQTSYFNQQTTSSGMFGGRTLGGSIAPGNGSFSGTPGSRTTQQDAAGQVTGSERYLRDSRQPGQFVGADTADTTAFFSALSGQQGNRSQFNLRNLGNNTDFNQENQQSRTNIVYRTTLSVGFDYPAPRPTALTAKIEERFRRLPGTIDLLGVSVRMEGTTAVLEGSVPSLRDRALAQQLVLLEAGISQVRNELVVRTSDAETLPVLPPAP